MAPYTPWTTILPTGTSSNVSTESQNRPYMKLNAQGNTRFLKLLKMFKFAKFHEQL